MAIKEASEAEKSVFNKKMKKLKKIKGSGTELISVYVPHGTNRSSVMNQLTDEKSQSSNIKDPNTRKNVQSALKKITNFLKRIDFEIPEKGLAVFAGNVSAEEGKSDIKLFAIRPIKKLETKLYWCDSEFNLEPLEEMAKPTDYYGLLLIDKNEATIAFLKGKKYEIVGHFKSRVAGKTRAGGQCLSPHSLIQLNNGNIVEIDSLKEGKKVLGMNIKSKSLKESIVKEKWNSKKQPVHIKTKFPRIDLVCSEDHLFFVSTENGIEEKPAKKLSKEDKLIMPERTEISGATQKLNPKQYYNKFTLTRKGLKKLVKKRKEKKLSQKKLGKRINLHQATVSALERGKFNPRNSFLKKYCTGLGLDFVSFVQKYCKKANKIKLSTKLTPRLSKILGYLTGDGTISKERISFFEEKKELVKKYKKILKKEFNTNVSLTFRKKKNYYQLRAYGKPLVRMINTEFPEIKNARESRIPRKVLKSKNHVLANFLKGFFDAEGFVRDRGVSLGINNELLQRQIQIALLRFGIISSIHEYKNKENPYSNHTRYTIDITEKESLKIFCDKIGFSLNEKDKKLKEAIKKRKGKSKVRQIIVPGTRIRKMFEREGINTQNFPKVSPFFRNQREMSKKVFYTSIMKQVKSNKELFSAYKKILESPILPVKIAKINKETKTINMIDIETGTNNFFSNSLLVHNSAKRFEHLREEAAHNFYKKVSEKMNQAFLKYVNKLTGIIIGGPGITKDYFLDENLLDHRLSKKILGKVNTSYTDESGVRELIQKSSRIIKEAEITKEIQTVQEFMRNIIKTGLATYGEKEVLKALKLGKVQTLLLSEELEKTVLLFKCPHCSEKKEKIVKEGMETEEKCSECGMEMKSVEEKEYIDWLMEKAKNIGANTKIISTDTDEGMQFWTAFGGIGAILRYK